MMKLLAETPRQTVLPLQIRTLMSIRGSTFNLDGKSAIQRIIVLRQIQGTAHQSKQALQML